MFKFFILFLFLFFNLFANTTADSIAQKVIMLNPNVKSIKKKINSINRAIKASKIIKDTVFALEYSSVPLDNPLLAQHSMSGIQFKIKQTFPFPGKNNARKNVVVQSKKVAFENLLILQNNLYTQVKKIYFLFVANKLLKEKSKEHLKLINKLIKIVKSKYENGASSQHQILKLLILKDKLMDKIEEYSRLENSFQAHLNSLLNRQLKEKIDFANNLVAAKNNKSLDDFLEETKKFSPVLRLLTQQSLLETKKAELTSFEKLPDLTAWLGYRIRIKTAKDAGTDFISAGISFSIPFDFTNRFRSKKLFFKEQSEYFRLKYVAVLNDFKFNIKDSILKWDRAFKKINFYQNKIIPNAKKEFNLLLAQYQSNKTKFEMLYESELEIILLEKKLILSNLKTVLMKIKVEQITGINLIKFKEFNNGK